MIGEEYGEDRPDAEFVWVLDPVDGTRAFIAGLPLWTTLIGLRHRGQPVLGLIGQPFLDETYVGSSTARGGSPAAIPNAAQGPRPCPKLTQAIIATTDPALFNGAEAGRLGPRCAAPRAWRGSAATPTPTPWSPRARWTW